MNNILNYDFELPDSLVANEPANPRDSSRLLSFNDDTISDLVFTDLVKVLPQRTLLIFNDTKVVKSRILFSVNGKRSELFFATDLGNSCFEVLAKPAQYFKIGATLMLPGNIEIEVVSISDQGTKIVKVLTPDFNYFSYLDKYGHVPLPPYIDTHGKDSNDFESLYQTVYSRNLGSVAAPTAGLHFTDDLLSKLKSNGVEFAFVTLQVGLGTFMPIRVNDIDDHKMHAENFMISEGDAKKINHFKNSGYTIISVGTTTLRAIQSLYDNFDEIRSGNYSTDIFIKPGYSNWFVDGLITNFHLPKSSLFILVSAFVGLENARKIYSHAINNHYRFYSFGDSSLLFNAKINTR